MNRLKSSLTCSNCLKLYKNPIELPCNHYICNDHLSENNIIKCDKCKKDFHVKDNDFKSTDLFLNKLISEQLYLSDEEMSLKMKIEESIKAFFNIYEEIIRNKNNLDLEYHNHFQEMRFKIDEHREKLKQKIDEISLEMIDQTKKYEVEYLKSLNEKLDASLKSLEIKSLENELKGMEDTFRDPKILLGEIREINENREKSISDIKSMLNEINHVKDHLKVTNQFRKNFSMNQESFGCLSLNEYSTFDPFKSQILTGNQPLELIKLCEFSLKDKWRLLYRGSRDGFDADDFHSKCDGHTNTLTIYQASATSFIFGGFASVDWESSYYGYYKTDPNAFLFSLTNDDNKPSKMKINSSQTHQALHCYSDFGPSFGAGGDIVILDNANTTMDSYSNLGLTYKHSQYAFETHEAQSFLAGSYYFQLSEIEVYQSE